jgi:hypothetical protein
VSWRACPANGGVAGELRSTRGLQPHRTYRDAAGDAIISRPLARLSGEDGSVVWSAGGEGLVDLALRADGSLITTDAYGPSVSARDVETGDERWTTVLDVRPGRIARSLQGDVVVTAHALGPASAPDDPFIVVALHAASGAERWRYETSGTADYIGWNGASDAAIDDAGDVVAGGFLSNLLPPSPTDWDQQPIVVKLAGISGAELWRRLMPPPGGGDARIDSVTIAPDGGVLTSVYGPDEIVKLSNAWGEDVWRTQWISSPEAFETDYVTTCSSTERATSRAGQASDAIAVGKYSGASGHRVVSVVGQGGRPVRNTAIRTPSPAACTERRSWRRRSCQGGAPRSQSCRGIRYDRRG